MKLYGIRFDPIAVAKLHPRRQVRAEPKITPPQAPTLPPAAVANKGGRPRKEFWDDLLIAMFMKIWNSELTPKTQTDIEKAMLDWASDNGHELGETAVKAPAKKLFMALKQ